jgi:hypothetical protein
VRLNADGNERLTKENFFRQLLRLVYRLIFVMAAEDREILHADGAGDVRKAAYANGYAKARLRERSRNRIACDRHHDACEAVKVVFRALRHGEPKLVPPALGGPFCGRTDARPRCGAACEQAVPEGTLQPRLASKGCRASTGAIWRSRSSAPSTRASWNCPARQIYCLSGENGHLARSRFGLCRFGRPRAIMVDLTAPNEMRCNTQSPLWSRRSELAARRLSRRCTSC